MPRTAKIVFYPFSFKILEFIMSLKMKIERSEKRLKNINSLLFIESLGKYVANCIFIVILFFTLPFD